MIQWFGVSPAYEVKRFLIVNIWVWVYVWFTVHVTSQVESDIVDSAKKNANSSDTIAAVGLQTHFVIYQQVFMQLRQWTKLVDPRGLLFMWTIAQMILHRNMVGGVRNLLQLFCTDRAV